MTEHLLRSRVSRADEGGISLKTRAHSLAAVTAGQSSARRREYFGGIWFKVFTERGPALPHLAA
jgi:hypothetical protein